MKYDFCSIMTMVLNQFEQAEEKARNGQESNPKSGVSAIPPRAQPEFALGLKSSRQPAHEGANLSQGFGRRQAASPGIV
jgi:hypothetical protein